MPLKSSLSGISKLRNVYIFWMGYARASQNCFNHVHTTNVHVSTCSRTAIECRSWQPHRVTERAFWSLPLNFLWKTKKFGFPAAENFWDVWWHSKSHRLKALVVPNKFHGHNICLEGLLLLRETNKSTLGVFKKAFLEVHLGGQNFDHFRVFNAPGKSRFHNFTKKYWK